MRISCVLLFYQEKQITTKVTKSKLCNSLTGEKNLVYVAHESRLLRNEANERLVASLNKHEDNNADTIDDTSNIYSVKLGISENL